MNFAIASLMHGKLNLDHNKVGVFIVIPNRKHKLISTSFSHPSFIPHRFIDFPKHRSINWNDYTFINNNQFSHHGNC
jgi:hypothetical protein